MTSYGDLLAATKTTRAMSTNESAQLVDDSCTILDVCEPEEFEQGSLPNATSRKYVTRKLTEQRIPDRDTAILVYCAADPIRPAAKTLADLGYTHAVSMEGGFTKWKSEGRNGRCPKPHVHTNKTDTPTPAASEVEKKGKTSFDAKVDIGAGGAHSHHAIRSGWHWDTGSRIRMWSTNQPQRQVIHNTGRIGQSSGVSEANNHRSQPRHPD